MKVKLDVIALDEDIYPRQNISKKTVESYVEALKGGAVFPPIVVQKIRDLKGEEKLICLDGWHRLLAYKEYNKQAKDEELSNRFEEVEVTFWKDHVLDKKEYLEELRVESARRNVIHGDRLSAVDLKFHLLRIVKDRPIERLNGIIKELSDQFRYSPSYISSLVGEEVRRRRMSRDAEIYKISLLGWTQKEIGELFGLTQQAVAKITTNFSTEISSIQDLFYEKHKPVEDIAKFYNLDDITTWAIILQGKNDLERFKLFGKPEYQNDEPMLYNVWNFAQRDPRLGYECPGNIPGQIVMNVLYYYTKQGDVVVDPMAGGGSTIDACLVMGRKCRAYDITNEWEWKGVKYCRKDIKIRNLWDGFMEEAKGCDLIFLDPPYWELQRGFYVKESVSEVSLKEWLTFMERVAKESFSTVRKGGHVALIVEAMVYERGTKEFYDLPYMCMKFFEEAGFKEIHRLSVPVTTQVKSHHDVEYAKKNKIILDINRDLIIYRKD